MNIQPPDFLRSPTLVNFGVSYAEDPDTAVREAVDSLERDGICFVLVFVPDRLDHDRVSAALNRTLPKAPVFGCTTAGQITPEGYEDDALLLVAFPRNHFRCASTLIQPLTQMSIEATALQARTLVERFQRTANWNRFAVTFADGLSKQEDVLVAALDAGLGDLPVFGGSAGHGLAFDETYVLHGGRCHTNAALLLVVETDLDFVGLEFDHFLPTERQLVVTDARPEDRIVTEINGAPAAPEYARLVGKDVSVLSPKVFAENPVLVRNHDTWHVRAIQQVVNGDSLAFLSAIENGLVLTLGQGKEILQTLDTELSVVGPDGQRPDFVLGFDCVLRRLEIEQNAVTLEASRILAAHRVLGFNTYGEQHRGVHMNQTFVGIAFFPPGRTLRP
jgi:hypothetical protein